MVPLEQRTRLGVHGLTTRSKKLLGTKGIATRSKDATKFVYHRNFGVADFQEPFRPFVVLPGVFDPSVGSEICAFH